MRSDPTELRAILHQHGLLEPPDVERVGDLPPPTRPIPPRRPARADAWRVPPPGFGAPAQVGPPPALGPGSEGVEVLVPDPGGDRQVVLLRRRGDRWDVVVPIAPDDVVRTDQIPRGADGALRIELSLGAHARRGRWAVLLAPPVDWSAPARQRWGPVRDALAHGQVPLVCFEGPIR